MGRAPAPRAGARGVRALTDSIRADFAWPSPAGHRPERRLL
ncbi:hypothetical protein ACFFX0_11545 [Citricoccus parietis]|uniref:Uncharacterized protein n=1 Tax=Citricoccus parietis TaxID=592307 RepID=A0ABV5FYP3_9MICC